MRARRSTLSFAAMLLAVVSLLPLQASASTLTLATLCGSATRITSPGVGVRLATQGVTYRTGGAWSSAISTLGDFTLSFDYSIDGSGSPAFQADGFAVVVQTTADNALGQVGGYLGYGGTTSEAGCRSIGSRKPSFAVGFDDYNDRVRAGQDNAWGTTLATNTRVTGRHSATIVKSGTSVTVVLDGKTVGSFTVGSSTYSRAYVGFTGATGSYTEDILISGVTLTRP